MNVFDAQLWIINRIQTEVSGFTTVGNPAMLAGLKDIGPLLPCCIVQPGAAEVFNKERNAVGLVEDQYWQVTVVVGYGYDAIHFGQTETIAGELMTSIIDAVSGKSPGMASGFVKSLMYDGRDDPVYGPGYAEFPMIFRIKKVVGNADFY